jgi:hypothetical protein
MLDHGFALLMVTPRSGLSWSLLTWCSVSFQTSGNALPAGLIVDVIA